MMLIFLNIYMSLRENSTGFITGTATGQVCRKLHKHRCFTAGIRFQNRDATKQKKKA
jgi:hypothetical protein